MLSFYAIVAWRMSPPPRAAANGWLLVLYGGVGLYLIKVLHSPIYFTFYDELLHYRTAANIIQTGRQFSRTFPPARQPPVPRSGKCRRRLGQPGRARYYTRGHSHHFIGAGIAFVLVMFLFYEKTSQSPRLAGIATLIYAANPHLHLFRRPILL
jgi:hypothetical protein